MGNNNEVEIKQKTPAQEVLIHKIMKSRKILDKEYRNLAEVLSSKVVTSYDAAVFIEYVLGMLKFRRHFFNGKHKAYKKCIACKSRDDIEKYYSYKDTRVVWLCENCGLNLGSNYVTKIKDLSVEELIRLGLIKSGDQELTPAQEDLIHEHREE